MFLVKEMGTIPLTRIGEMVMEKIMQVGDKFPATHGRPNGARVFAVRSKNESATDRLRELAIAIGVEAELPLHRVRVVVAYNGSPEPECRVDDSWGLGHTDVALLGERQTPWIDDDQRGLVLAVSGGPRPSSP